MKGRSGLCVSMSRRSSCSSLLRIPLFYFTLLVILSTLNCISAQSYNCCLSSYNALGQSCDVSGGVVVDGITYNCVTVDGSCDACLLSTSSVTEVTSSSQCSTCCIADSDTCDATTTAATLSTLSKCDFPLSCPPRSIVF